MTPPPVPPRRDAPGLVMKHVGLRGREVRPAPRPWGMEPQHLDGVPGNRSGDTHNIRLYKEGLNPLHRVW